MVDHHLDVVVGELRDIGLGMAVRRDQHWRVPVRKPLQPEAAVGQGTGDDEEGEDPGAAHGRSVPVGVKSRHLDVVTRRLTLARDAQSPGYRAATRWSAAGPASATRVPK